MKLKTKILSFVTSCAVALSAAVAVTTTPVSYAENSDNIANEYAWDAVRVGGGGFVSSIVTGENVMYARTDVGGAYRFNYETECWEQMLTDLNEADRGLLSVDAIAIDPTDDNTIYMLCGCAYFSDARTEIFKSTDGGRTFERTDVTDLIQVHANGYGRQCGESLAVDPEDPDTIYCGGDVTAGESCLIKSTDGGKTWAAVKGYDDLGMYTNEIKWPTWTEHIARGTGTGEYGTQNGVSTITIENGKVYVGTIIKGTANVVVADVESDVFTALSEDLPQDLYPARFVLDGAGNIFITYMNSIMLDKTQGAIYKYNTTTGEVKDISPSSEGYGGISAVPGNPDKLIASTCANSPMSQLWYENAWKDDKVAWGERFFKTEDGGETWEEITPGNAKTWGGPLQADYLQDGGYEWIRNKSIHWSGAAVIDPKNTDRFFVTSGNGIFRCDDVWSELPVYTFHPDGIEEIVALDMVSIPDGNVISAIGDYDGFIHVDPTKIPQQHQPNMGSTGAIAYCPQNPDVMIRIAEYNNDIAPGFYTTDGGKTWTKMSNSPGGKAAITQLDDGTYRFFKSAGGNDKSSAVSYSDDFGQTWTACSGIPSAYGSKPTNMYVDPEDPSLVYAYVTYYNESWFYSKPEPTAEDAQYKLCVSTDYGATFTSKDVAMYDQCDSAGRIATLGDDSLILGAGWYGMYKATNQGQTIEKIDTVSYCKTVGYGAPEKEGGVNTLYMYGKPQDSDPEGIYRSTDGGETWVCINTDKLYGGTGNGNFLVGDMNTFGTVYMSTVGCGIVYGCLSDNPVDPTEPTEETTEATTEPTEETTEAATTATEETDPTEETTEAATTATEETDPTEETSDIPDETVPSYTGTEELLYGDVDLDDKLAVADVIALAKYLLNESIYPLGMGDDESVAKAWEQSNVALDDKVNSSDLSKLVEFHLQTVDKTQLGKA